MDENDSQQFLVTGRYIFGKYFKFNHHTATKKQVELIKDRLNLFISDILGTKGEKKIITEHYINAIITGGYNSCQIIHME